MRRIPPRIVAALLIAVFVAGPPAAARDLIPPNDNLSAATVVDELPYRSVRDLALTTREPDEPVCTLTPAGTIWYRYQSDTAKNVWASVDYGPARVAVYTGSTFEDLSRVAECAAGVRFRAEPGLNYYIQVSWQVPFSTLPDDHVVVAFDESGAIEGRLRDELGDPAGDVCVIVSAHADGYGSVFPDEIRTAADGTYRVSHLPAGEYHVSFGCFGGRYGHETIESVRVRSGRVTAGVDATLALFAAISGSVRDEEGNLITNGLCAVAHDAVTGLVAGEVTTYTGHYTIPVFAGSYKLTIGCSPAYSSSWYDSRGSFEEADVITVGEHEERSGIDMTLAPWVSPPGDTPETAIDISTVPFSVIGNFADARDDESDWAMCNDYVGPSLWFRFAPAHDAELVVSLDDRAPGFGVWTQGPAGWQQTSCTDYPDGRRSMVVVAQAGQSYLIRVAGLERRNARVSADTTTAVELVTYSAAVPCYPGCDFDPRSVCGDEPVSPPGSWDDRSVTVPAMVDGAVPTHLVAAVGPAVDRDLFICRASGPDRFVAMAASGAMQIEAAAVPVVPGERYTIRVFNWADVFPSPGSISYVVQR